MTDQDLPDGIKMASTTVARWQLPCLPLMSFLNSQVILLAAFTEYAGECAHDEDLVDINRSIFSTIGALSRIPMSDPNHSLQ